jgi:glutamate 5-kinase
MPLTQMAEIIMQQRKDILKAVKRLVVKVGTSQLADPATGVDLAMMGKLVSEIQSLRKQGLEVVLVTSGAIGMGMCRLGLKTKPKEIPAKQATAAVGQGLLMNHYQKCFADFGVPVGQVLLTRADFENRQRYLNARNCLQALLAMGAVPVINENDTVAVDEIKFGDNDNLAAQVTNMAQAQLLVILTDVEGLFEQDPRKHASAKRIALVPKITPALAAAAGGEGSAVGTGGMATKIQAARTVTASGELMAIAAGRAPKILEKLLKGEDVGTLFLPTRDRLDHHRRWIAFSLKPKGALLLDEGAARAVRERGKSLLPTGLKAVQGRFESGCVVRLLGPGGEEIARGLCHYSSDECERLKGAKSSEIESRLGFKVKDELVHRDDMVLSDLG